MSTPMAKRTPMRLRGQATIEMVIGLVGLAALFFGIELVCRLGDAGIANLMEAREKADEDMDRGSATYGVYVRTWRDGVDALSYTADDQAVTSGGGLETFRSQLEAPMDMQWLVDNPDFHLRGHDVMPLLGGSSIAYAADMRKGVARSVLGLEEGAQDLLFGGLAKVTLEDRVVMPGFFLTGETGAEP